MRESLAITGARGFIGAAVLGAANDSAVRLLVRSGQVEPSRNRTVIRGDLRDPAALHRLVDGATILLHCASYVGHDAAEAISVNDVATKALVEAAKIAGVSRIIYVSTTGVYGRGPFTDASETTEVAPESVTSRTRANAEEHVLAAGGTVIRPHLLYGIGDRKVIPTLLRTVAALQGIPEPSPPVSALSVRQLAHQIHLTSRSPDLRGKAVHADHGPPVQLTDLFSVAPAAFDISQLHPIPVAQVRDVLHRTKMTPHQINMLTAPNTFSSTIAGRAGPVNLDATPSTLSWYRRSMR